LKKLIRWTITPVAVFVLLAGLSAAGEVTVGTFVERIAQAKQLDLNDTPKTPESLREAGVPLPPDMQLTEPLTEGHVARIARSMGLDVSTNRPGATFTAEQVDRFFEAYQVDLALRGEAPAAARPETGGTARFDPFLKAKGAGKGKKKGRGFTPSEPE